MSHLALVPDGNRRWARARGLSAAEGHRAGITNVGRIATRAWARGVRVVTFWWGSPANLQKRSPPEVAGILDALTGWLGEGGAGRALLAQQGAGFEVLGRWRELCPQVEPALPPACAPDDPRPRLVLLLAYDGRDEILAARDLPRDLWTAHLPPVDVVVRTGGEPHLSAGFLLWSIAEAALVFSRRPWPDFRPADLDRALDRLPARRFGA